MISSKSSKLVFVFLLILTIIPVNGLFAAGKADLPDIVAKNFQVTPVTGKVFVVGQPVLVKCTVGRVKQKVKRYKVVLYRGNKVIMNRIISPEAAKRQVVVTKKMKLNPSILKYSCVADSRNDVKESNERNNRLEVTLSGGDIKMQDLGNTESVSIGGEGDTPLKYKKQSDLKALKVEAVLKPNSQTIEKLRCYYKYTGDPLTDRWETVFSAFNGAIKIPRSFGGGAVLKEGEGYIESLDISSYNLKEYDKKMNLKCILDFKNQIKETNENNNTAEFEPKEFFKGKVRIPDIIATDLFAGPLSPDSKTLSVVECGYKFEMRGEEERWYNEAKFHVGLYEHPKKLLGELELTGANMKAASEGKVRFMLPPGSNYSIIQRTGKFFCHFDNKSEVKEFSEDNNIVYFNKQKNEKWLAENGYKFAESDIYITEFKFEPEKNRNLYATQQIPKGKFICKWGVAKKPVNKGWTLAILVQGKVIDSGKINISAAESKIGHGNVEVEYKGYTGEMFKDIRAKCVVDYTNNVKEILENNNSKEILFKK